MNSLAKQKMFPCIFRLYKYVGFCRWKSALKIGEQYPEKLQIPRGASSFRQITVENLRKRLVNGIFGKGNVEGFDARRRR